MTDDELAALAATLRTLTPGDADRLLQLLHDLTGDAAIVQAFADRLVDSDGAAKIHGVSSGVVIRNYANRRPFPEGVLPRDPARRGTPGVGTWWWAPDIERDRQATPTRRRRSDEPDDPPTVTPPA